MPPGGVGGIGGMGSMGMDNPAGRPDAAPRHGAGGPYFPDSRMTGQAGGDEYTGLMDDPMNRLSDLQPTEMRKGFIRKVYGILAVQMLVTVACIIPFYTNPDLQVFVFLNPGIVWVAFLMTIVFMCVISCNPQLARTFPQNYYLLGGFTLCEGFLLGVTLVHQEGVLLAALVTAVVVGALTAFVCFTETDFSGMAPYLFCLTVGLLVLGILAMALQIPALTSFYAGCGAVLFCCYLIHDTQTIVGGKHVTYQISVDDYVFAALVLYLDIINLFLYILHLIGGGRD